MSQVGVAKYGEVQGILKPKGVVGFGSLPQQLVKKVVSQGFVFNVLCVGETGIGKSTLMESLFNMPMDFTPTNYELNTVELRSKTFEMTESGVDLSLTIVETAGYGDQLGKDQSAQVIVEYVEKQFEQYLQEEMKPRRNLHFYKDTRIHACIYFISPTGYGMKALDIVTMRALATRTNVIPVIAKADTTSKGELQKFKAKILSELKENGIQLYNFPTDEETVREINNTLNSYVPFSVIGSCDFVNKGVYKVRARQYPWGIVEVENEQHCDFVKLREALLRVNVADLRERTHTVLYERYRGRKLKEMGVKEGEMEPQLADITGQRLTALKDVEGKEQRRIADQLKEKYRSITHEIEDREKQLKQKSESIQTVFQTKLEELEKTIGQLDKDKRMMEQLVNSENLAPGSKTKTKKWKK